MAYEITKENSVVYSCEKCRKECIYDRLHASAKCMIKACTFCGEIKLVNVYEDGATFIQIDKDGIAMDTYVEREGV
jgi:hypothetical protein